MRHITALERYEGSARDMGSHPWTAANFEAVQTNKQFISLCHSMEASELFVAWVAQFSSQLRALTI